MDLVFVYGTLRKGRPNYDADLLEQSFLGQGTSVEAYPLCITGRWYSPVVFPEPGTGSRFRGELYKADTQLLYRLDQIELVGNSQGYRREQIDVERDRGDIVMAWCYMKSRDIAQPVHGRFLREYSDHRYVPRSKRPPGS